MKIYGSQKEIALVLSAIPGANNYPSPIPPDGWIGSYEGIPIEIVTISDGRPSPCDLCAYNPPSSTDGKPCCMCPSCPV